MNKFLIYISEASIVFAALYSVYYLTVKRLTFHWLNRILLLTFVPLSVIIPAINIDIKSNVGSEIFIPKFGEVISTHSLETVEHNFSSHQFFFERLILIIYIFGILLCIIKMISSVSRLFKIKRSGKIIQFDKFSIILAHIPSVFSFFNWIFIPNTKSDENEYPIIEHEKIHFKLLHTVDLMITEIFIALFWFNPFVYFYRRSVKSVHEYQVDAKVLNKGIKKSHYLQLILSDISRDRNMVNLYNYFNYLNIKKRVMMITKRQSNKFQLSRYLLFLPVIAIMSMSAPKTFDDDKPNIYPIKKREFFKITQDFGKEFKHPVTQKVTIHGGIDLSAEEGISVLSTASGLVKAVTTEEGWGNLIIVDHGNGFETWYAHLKDFSVKKGVKVEKAQEIGFVGNTGYSTGSHLHYEIRLNGKKVNPRDYIE